VSAASERRRRVAHVAAPVLFLAAVTVAVLLVRSGLHAGSPGTTSTQQVTSVATTTAPPKKRAHGGRAGYYTVQTGDTFNSIAAKTGVRVSELERLNPHVSPNALQIGQKLRVK
jgi:LysM repeat protein